MWTYTGDPNASPRDNVRFLISDVTQTAQSLSDEEVDYLIRQYPDNIGYAAGAAAEAMADRYSGLSATSKSVGDLSISHEYGATALRFAAMAKRIRQKHHGIVVDLMADSSDKVFHLGMHDFPRVNTLENTPAAITW